jgi:hypothetical protein
MSGSSVLKLTLSPALMRAQPGFFSILRTIKKNEGFGHTNLKYAGNGFLSYVKNRALLLSGDMAMPICRR